MVGLADETVRAVPVLPTGGLAADLPLVREQLDYRESRWPMATAWRLRRLGPALKSREPDIVHAVDGEHASAAGVLARAAGAALVVSCWSQTQLQAALSAAGSVQSGGSSAAVTCATQPLEDAAGRLAGSEERVRLVRPGVIRAARSVAPPLGDPAQALCCVMISSGQADPAATALLEGMAAVAGDLPQLQLFIYTVDGDGRALWSAAMRLGLLDRVVLVSPDSSSQNLLVQCDAVLTPQPLGVVRTLVLNAMAAGRPVIGPADPIAEYLHHGRTAHLLDRSTAPAWSATFRSLVEQPETLRQLGIHAQQYVGEHYSASGFVGRMLELYRGLLAQPLAFEPTS